MTPQVAIDAPGCRRGSSSVPSGGDGPRVRLAASVSGTRVDRLSSRNVNFLFVALSGGSHTLFDLSGHGQESLFDVGGVLG